MGLARFTASANSSPALPKRQTTLADGTFLVKFKLSSRIIGRAPPTLGIKGEKEHG
jgi:hypothetical protein